MNIFLYLILFVMGTVFGSFLTLATYRIPLNKDITHEHSFCPHCNYKLAFWDLIPILSYLFLGGKCRKCKKKISARYPLIEFLTGLSFVGLGLALQLNIYTIGVEQIIQFAIGVLYIVFLFLIAGIDFEHGKIDKRTIIYGVVVALINIIYEYTLASMDGYAYNLNRIIIYLVSIIFISIINIETIRKTKKYDYMLDLLIVAVIMSLVTYEVTAILSIILTLLIVAIKLLINKLFTNKKKKDVIVRTPIAAYLVISNAIVFIISCYYTISF